MGKKIHIESGTRYGKLIYLGEGGFISYPGVNVRLVDDDQ